MIYLEEKFNILPASPATLDVFIELALNKLVPICEDLGARLVAAWYSDSEWFSQATHIMEFDDLDALKRFRINTSQNSTWGEYLGQLEDIAPERKSRLLEPLGPVPPEKLHKAIKRSQKTKGIGGPIGVYSIATLEVAPDKMPEFLELIKLAAAGFPIIASWRPIGGSPNEVIDLWGMALRQEIYAPADKNLDENFFIPLRKLAPKERLINIYTLPYSPLK